MFADRRQSKQFSSSKVPTRSDKKPIIKTDKRSSMAWCDSKWDGSSTSHLGQSLSKLEQLRMKPKMQSDQKVLRYPGIKASPGDVMSLNSSRD